MSTVRFKIPPSCWSFLALTLIIFLATTSIAAEESKYFSIKMNDQLIGYAVTNGDTIKKDGQELLRLKSETALKLALLGTERNTRLESETVIDPKTGHPLSYHMTDTTNEVVRHVESEFSNGLVRTWIYREGEPRGEPVESTLSSGAVILGSNNFAHWQLLLKAARDCATNRVAKISVFLPDIPQVESFELVRDNPRDIVMGDKVRRCVEWRLKKANINAFADADTNELLRLDLPAQQTTIEFTDPNIVKLAQKTRAEEILTRHFTPSDVAFDDFLKVSQMKAHIDVKIIASGIADDLSVLTTKIQQFDGKKEEDHIVGEVSICSTRYTGDDSPVFPTSSVESELDNWLKPSMFIESNDASIITQSAELTKGAKTRWDAVQSIGKWVHQEITYTIADTPSARLALEKKKGDCGPHATLMVAMLRAAGIPARLVGGLVYTPTLGGTFGQHAWVEVHMGQSGWIAMDPTTGEFDQLSATHIKLFEGLGGVIPESVKVTAFEPPNCKTVDKVSTEIKPLPWKLGKKYTFKYTQGDKEIGSEIFTITKIKNNGEEAYQLVSDVALKVNPTASLTSNTTLTVTTNVRPISFTRNLSVLTEKVKIECLFQDGVVHEEISGTKNLSHKITLPDGAYCFDNNMMGCWVLICSQLQFEPDKPVNIKTFHPSSLQIIPLQFTPQAPAPIQIGGKQVVCYECEVAPIKNAFWISRDGRFVRAKQEELVIEVTEVD